VLEAAKSPAIIADGGAARGDWAPHVGDLIAALEAPYFTTILGKGIVDETSQLYGGCYAGKGSIPQTAAAVEAADCLLWLGNLPSDFNT
jgi:pyruvate decarboxylase